MISESQLEQVLSAAAGMTVALVGDLFLDRYLEVESSVEEISIETGLEAYQVNHVRNAPGALGTVMNNLAALGIGGLVPVTVIGDDGHGHDLLKSLSALPADPQHILQDAKRLTPTYTKPMRTSAEGNRRELNRLDVKSRGPIEPGTRQELLIRLEAAFEDCDALIVLDQVAEPDWGVVHQEVRALLAQLAERHPERLIFVDSRAQIGEFSCGVLKPNQPECLRAAGFRTAAANDKVPEAVEKLARRTGRPVFCTLGSEGMLVAENHGRTAHVPGIPISGPIDIVGAGDSATAGIVTALCAGASSIQAAALGNLVASITIQQLGVTGVATPDQLRTRRARIWPSS